MLYRILDRATYTQAITALALSNIERTLSKMATKADLMTALTNQGTVVAEAIADAGKVIEAAIAQIAQSGADVPQEAVDLITASTAQLQSISSQLKSALATLQADDVPVTPPVEPPVEPPTEGFRSRNR